MKYSKLLLIMTFALSLVLSASAVALAQPVQNTTSGDLFDSIQEAVNAASPYDTIEVDAATYDSSMEPGFEPAIMIHIDKAGLTLRSINGSALIDGQDYEVAIIVVMDDVTIDGFTVEHAGKLVSIPEAGGVTISDNTLQHGGVGLSCSGCPNIRIVGNTISENTGIGIGIDPAPAAMITGNTITANAGGGMHVGNAPDAVIEGNGPISNPEWHAIAVVFSPRARIADNVIDGSRYSGIALIDSQHGEVYWNTVSNIGGEGGIEIGRSPGARVYENMISSTEIGIGVHDSSDGAAVEDNDIEVDDGEGISLGDSDGCTITRNRVSGNGTGAAGIHVANARDFDVSDNAISDTIGSGIQLFNIAGTDTDTNLVRRNTITDNAGSHGIQVEQTSFVTIEANTITRGGEIGIGMGNSHDLLVAGNTATLNEHGITLYLDTNIEIRGNTLTDNFINGLLVHGGADHQIVGNTMINNSQNGVFLLEGASYSTIESNTVEANGAHGVVVQESPANTIRDNPSISGNAYQGVLVYGSPDTVILRNSMTDNGHSGVAAGASPGLRVEENTTTNNARNGIAVFRTESAVVANNTAQWNGCGLIMVGGTANGSVTGNILTDNSRGAVGIDALTPTFYAAPQPQTDARGNAFSGNSPNPLTACVIPLTVEIDIKPGSFPNSFNPNESGVIPVAILGSPVFDASMVDPESVQLESLPVRVVGKKGNLQAHLEDVNNDGFDDLVVQIEDLDGVFAEGDTEATLTGQLLPQYGGGKAIPFEGNDSINVVGLALPRSPLQVYATGVTPNPMVSGQSVRFFAQGSGIQSIQVQVLDLSGRGVFSSDFTAGNTLSWNLVTDQGERLANGVYLYLVTIRGADGRIQRSEVKKLVVMR